MSLICPECGALMLLRNSKYGKFYGCSKWPQCKGTHGAHPDGEPLGFPAKESLKKLRRLAHQELEKVFGRWEVMTSEEKKKMYKWLEANTRTGHVGAMNENDIEELFKALKERK